MISDSVMLPRRLQIYRIQCCHFTFSPSTNFITLFGVDELNSLRRWLTLLTQNVTERYVFFNLNDHIGYLLLELALPPDNMVVMVTIINMVWLGSGKDRGLG